MRKSAIGSNGHHDISNPYDDMWIPSLERRQCIPSWRVGMNPWNAFESTVKVTGARLTRTADDCARAAKELGINGLPPSYIEYVGRFGAGEWHPDLVIQVPYHPKPPMALDRGIQGWRRCLINHDSKPSRRHLMPFGGHANGYSLCWDTSCLMENGEMSICLVDHDPFQIIDCGSHLLEFLSIYWVNGQLDVICPLDGGSWGCKGEFRAIV